jgi:DNA-binding NarL/FixJ family response regulator
LDTLELSHKHLRPALGKLYYHAKKMTEIAVALNELDENNIPPEGPPDDAVSSERLKSLAARLIHQADHRVVSVRTSCSSWPLNGELELFHHLHTDLLARRGSVRMLLTSSVSSDPAAIADLRQLSQAGAQIRVYPCDLPVMIIMDSIASIVGTIGRDGQTHLTVVRDEGVIRVLQAFHNAIWNQAIGILALQEFAVDRNEPIIRKVLELLASGYTDETAARKLNLSVRTYRRYTAQLMSQLKAKSRFQAGVLAARLGLVESVRLPSAMAVAARKR